MLVTCGLISLKGRLSAEHYKQYEDYNYITYTVICISDRI
jgi:hypothetical protein